MPTQRIVNVGDRAISSSDAHWGHPPESATLDVSQVHVWMAKLASLEGELERLLAMLDGEERARADRFRFQRDRNRFILCHGVLRVILGRYLGRPPQRLRFGYSPHGKPFVEGAPADGLLQFNLSHSEDVGLVAVASGRRVGVDVERIRPDRETAAIAERFFSHEEVAALRALPEAARRQAFFRSWTRKEAYIKARGEGLFVSLASFAVSLDSGPASALLRSDLGPEEVSRWSLCDLEPPAGYAATLAVEGAGWCLRRWLLPPGLLAANGLSPDSATSP